MLMATDSPLSAAAVASDAPATGLDAATFRNAMARLAAAVHVVTTRAADGSRSGFTATAVCSVSDTPPSLLVCINRKASVYPVFSACSVLCVNTLAAGQQPLGHLFGGKTPMGERFAAARWDTLGSGAPALAGALVNFDCRIAARTSAGTHDILVCRVVAIRARSDGNPLIYADRNYRELPARQD